MQPVGSVRTHRVSLPREHGAWLVLAGAVVTGVSLAPRPGPALGAAVVVAVAFVARAIAERVAVAAPLRAWDRSWSVALLAIGGAATAEVAMARLALGAALAAGAIAMVVGAALVRRGRRHRDPMVELVALGGLGGSAGVVAFAGGAAIVTAALAGAVLALHAAGAVPLVRAAVRGRRVAGVPWLLGLGVAVAVAAAIAQRAPVALALAPRMLQLALHDPDGAARQDPRAIGVRETVLLVGVVVIVVLAA
jgi:YwiC-like protein